jgi:hypothetical protein
MGVLEDLADDLARQVLEAETDEDDGLALEVSKVIGVSSQTLQEAYMTAIRVRRAHKRAQSLIESKRRG